MAVSSVTRHAMPSEFGGKSGTECINTRVPLVTLLCAGYSVKLSLSIGTVCNKTVAQTA